MERDRALELVDDCTAAAMEYGPVVLGVLLCKAIGLPDLITVFVLVPVVIVLALPWALFVLCMAGLAKLLINL
jgi:hypothetical protein